MAFHRSPRAFSLFALLISFILVSAKASAQGNLRAGVPNLDPQVAGHDRPGQEFNCIAHTLGIHNQSIDPMTGPANAPYAFMDQVYGAHGFQRQNVLDLQPALGVQKIALYASTFPDGSVKQITHAALQEPDGSWTSKPADLPLVRHADANALDESQYGIPVATYVRQAGAGNGGAFAGAFRQAGMRNLAPAAMDFGMAAMGDGGGFAMNDAGMNLGNNFVNPMNGGNQLNPPMQGNGFAQGVNNAGHRKRHSANGTSSSSFGGGGFGGFVAAGASGNGFSAMAMVSFGGGIRQAGMACLGNDYGNANASHSHGSHTNTGTTGAMTNPRNTAAQSGNNIFVSIKGNNDTVNINTLPGDLVGKGLRIKIVGDNNVVKINSSGTTSNGARRSNGTGNLVGTRASNRTNSNQAIANNTGNTQANSTTALNHTSSHNALRHVANNQLANATHSTAGTNVTSTHNAIRQIAHTQTANATHSNVTTGLTNNRSTGTANRSRTTANLTNFAQSGHMTNTLRAAAANRSYQPSMGNHYITNRFAVNHSAMHYTPTNFSLARRR